MVGRYPRARPKTRTKLVHFSVTGTVLDQSRVVQSLAAPFTAPPTCSFPRALPVAISLPTFVVAGSEFLIRFISRLNHSPMAYRFPLISRSLLTEVFITWRVVATR